MSLQTVQVSASMKANGYTVGGTSANVLCDQVKTSTVVIPAGAVNMEVDFTAKAANVQAFAIESSVPKTVPPTGSDQNVTAKANDITTPAFTLTMALNKQIQWYIGSTFTNPITADVTKLYFSNSGTDAAEVKILLGDDITP